MYIETPKTSKKKQMESFISETLDDILKTTKSFENVVFILPSQRAGVFVKKKLTDKISAGFLPEILNIEQFIEGVSKVKKADSIQLLFHFYTIYKEQQPHPDSFEVFSSWAFIVLQDFNEIDQHLVNASNIFTYLRDIERLKKWSVNGTFKETELIINHHSFIEKLSDYYHVFYDFLIAKKIGYQGLIYREATQKIEAFSKTNQHKKFFFIGFNALNNSEELLFQKMLENGNSEIYWDLDIAFFEGNHQAGNFIRKYKETWKYYEKNELKSLGNSFQSEKNIEIIGASKNITQLKYAGEILKKFPNFSETALVLADETLLPIALNSLPKEVSSVNITMGYPLKNIPTTSLIFSIFQLFLSQQKLQKTATNLFYYKDVLAFFKHPLIHQLLAKENPNFVHDITKNITGENSMFISLLQLENYLKSSKDSALLSKVFNPFSSISEFLSRIISLINRLKEDVNDLEKEYLFRFFTAFTQLQNLHKEFGYFQDLKTLHQFFNQVIISETLSFQGEPLQGLQLMGMLETRVLDFENVIITSVNEGVLPGNSSQNSFIPFDVKVEYGLPTYREKDAIFSYHFFRLLQRAKNIFLIYNTEHDSFGSGEKSRFVKQLELLREDVSTKNISPRVVTEKKQLKEIKKTERTQIALQKLAEDGISPSAFTNYLVNPISFYKQKILKINEFQDVEETVAFNTLGNVVHDTLDTLYSVFKNRYLVEEDIAEMQTKSKDLVTKYFIKYFKSGDLKTGKNRLVFEVANRFVENFLSKEKTLLQDKTNQLKIIDTEPHLSASIKVDGIPFPIKIHGKIDRIDCLNGVTRIIDYKTGMADHLNLKVSDFETIKELKYHKAIQVLLYSFLYTENTPFDFSTPLEAGIFSFKNLNKGFLKVNFSASSASKLAENNITPKKIAQFMDVVKTVLLEIYNPETPFLEPQDLPDYSK